MNYTKKTGWCLKPITESDKALYEESLMGFFVKKQEDILYANGQALLIKGRQEAERRQTALEEMERVAQEDRNRRTAQAVRAQNNQWRRKMGWHAL